MIDEIPLTVVFDGSEATSEQVHVQGRHGGRQKPENRIVGRIVKVTAGDDMVDADGRERIDKEPEPLHGDAAPRLRLSRAAVLGRVMVYQYGECSAIPCRTIVMLD